MMPTENVRITLGEMQDALNKTLKGNDISRGAAVIWAEICEEGGRYESDDGETLMTAAPGSLVMEIEQMRDGQVMRGLLQLQPAKITGKLN